MAGSTAYRLTEPALADSLSRACYRGVTNLRRVYLLNADQPGLPGRNLPCVLAAPAQSIMTAGVPAGPGAGRPGAHRQGGAAPAPPGGAGPAGGRAGRPIRVTG